MDRHTYRRRSVIFMTVGLLHDANEPLDEFEEAQTMCDIPIDEDNE